MPVKTRRQSAAGARSTDPYEDNAHQLQDTDTSTITIKLEEQDVIDTSARTFQKVFYPQDVNNAESDSDYHDINRRRSKKRVSKVRHRGVRRVAPDVSDNEFVQYENAECPLSSLFRTKPTRQLSSNKAETTAGRSDFLIEINADSHKLATLNLSTHNLPSQHHPSTVTSTVKLISRQDKPQEYRCKHSHFSDRFRASFLSLPWELRIRIYRQVFVSVQPIVFHRRSDFSRTSSLLRTCRQIASEGASILYGENTFHFERTSACRGAFFDRAWPEVGFKDIRRLFHAIGPVNIAYLRSVSFRFTDSDRRGNPSDISNDIVHFVEDPILHDILFMLGRNTILDEFGIMFHNNSSVSTQNYYFLKALTSIQCRRLMHNGGKFEGRVSIVAKTLLENLKAVMVVKDQGPRTRYVEEEASRIAKLHAAHTSLF